MDIAIMAQKHSSFTYLMTLVSEVKPHLSAEKEISRDTEHFFSGASDLGFFHPSVTQHNFYTTQRLILRYHCHCFI